MRLLLILFFALSAEAQVIDHTCRDFNQIPARWRDSVRAKIRLGYAHTSHGYHLVRGMWVLRDYLSGFGYTRWNAGFHAGDVVNEVWSYPTGYYDLGNGVNKPWPACTRTMLALPGNDRNVVMWAWCNEMIGNTASNVQRYLDSMALLERQYPNVKFVYMTAHNDGAGPTGTTNVLNNIIRDYCRANNKWLYDFADIESYDPDGRDFLALGSNENCDYSGGNWASEWIARNPTHQLTQLANVCDPCDHSQTLNCVLKGGAAWWLLARLSGWEGIETDPLPVSSHGIWIR